VSFYKQNGFVGLETISSKTSLCELCVQDSDMMEQGFDGLSLTMS